MQTDVQDATSAAALEEAMKFEGKDAITPVPSDDEVHQAATTPFTPIQPVPSTSAGKKGKHVQIMKESFCTHCDQVPHGADDIYKHVKKRLEQDLSQAFETMTSLKADYQANTGNAATTETRPGFQVIPEDLTSEHEQLHQMGLARRKEFGSKPVMHFDKVEGVDGAYELLLGLDMLYGLGATDDEMIMKAMEATRGNTALWTRFTSTRARTYRAWRRIYYDMTRPNDTQTMHHLAVSLTQKKDQPVLTYIMKKVEAYRRVGFEDERMLLPAIIDGMSPRLAHEIRRLPPRWQPRNLQDLLSVAGNAEASSKLYQSRLDQFQKRGQAYAKAAVATTTPEEDDEDDESRALPVKAKPKAKTALKPKAASSEKAEEAGDVSFGPTTVAPDVSDLHGLIRSILTKELSNVKNFPVTQRSTQQCVGTCWGCGAVGHIKRDCPKMKEFTAKYPEATKALKQLQEEKKTQRDLSKKRKPAQSGNEAGSSSTHSSGEQAEGDEY